MKEHNSTTSRTVLFSMAIATSAVATTFVSYVWHRKWMSRQEKFWQDRRLEERTGRIRAEVSLRKALKEVQQLKLQQATNSSSATITKHPDCDGNVRMVLHAIGRVVSPYTKRVGTPRQAQLVPSSRGYIEFTIPSETLSGIDQYSHVWIIFEFHANTDIANKNGTGKTKIRPPRGGGIKLGQLATRSPHRPNPLGLSLVKLEQWDESKRQLHVSGLDLVHGTPVYDCKPCVPWDVPGYPQVHSHILKVPSWVDSDGDIIPHVDFTAQALSKLADVVATGRLGPWYTDHNGGYNAAKQTLHEILVQDPRSSHRGLKNNARGTSSDADPLSYRLLFGPCQVEFVVVSDPHKMVLVQDIAVVEFDRSQYVDGVPLVSI